MIAVGSRWALAWRHPHRIEATVIALEAEYVVADVVHRCPPTCELLQMRATLPIEGRLRYTYAAFDRLFERMAEGAIALPGATS